MRQTYRTHFLKTWPQFFDAVLEGKPFEVRRNDRAFRERDLLVLQEWDPRTKRYTGREVTRVVVKVWPLDDVGIVGFAGLQIAPAEGA